MPRSPTPSGHQGSPTLKQILKAADILLKPPKALPSNPPELLPRLRACSKALPKEWRRIIPEWSEDDEMDHVGDNDGSDISEERKKKRRDELVFVVGKRCFAMAKAMQSWLEKEFWPKEQRDGLEDKDFLLGTADLRLIRLMLSHTTFSYLLPLTVQYAESLPIIPAETANALAQVLEATLKLLKVATPPAPDAGPSSRMPTSPTAITQSLLSSHLIPVFLSTLILAYTPSIPAEHYGLLRMAFLQALMSLTPGHAISSLVNVLKLLVQGRRENAKVNGWVREWPKYPEGIINGLLTAQVRRPGGVRGLMENVLGDTARTDDVTSIEGKRLDHIFNVLVRIPRQVTPEIYYPWLLSELFSMIPLDESSSHHPVAYVNTACYCIQRLWRSNPSIGEWLKNKLHSPWYPKSLFAPADGPAIEVTSWLAIQRSVQNIRLLLIHNPASPDFVEFLVGSILPPLFSLHTFLFFSSQAPNPVLIRPVGSLDASRSRSLADDVSFILTSWGKTVEKDVGVIGLWSLVDAGKGWKPDENGVVPEFFWERQGDGVRLMSGSQGIPDITPEIVFPSLNRDELDPDAIAQRIRDQTEAMPDPTLLCKLIKDINRPDIACQVILRALHLWRIKSPMEKEPSVEAMLHLQLTMKLMTHLGSELFTEPEQLLEWVELTLSGQADCLEDDLIDEEAEETNQKPLITEVGGEKGKGKKDDDVPPDGNRGLIELACRLLAAEEVKKALSEKDLAILHPILAHLEVISELSPSSSIRLATREAMLILLSIQASANSSAPTDSKKSSKEAFDKALELIKDKAVPVRAHGLNMLKDLVYQPYYDSSLTPVILNTFMSSIEDDDSFVYLCALKGLNGMVDALGGEVFEKLMDSYAGMAKELRRLNDADEVDKMLRLAEAVDQVIERTGDALGLYADKIIPVLMSIFPDTSLSTAIRSSALSLLTTCAKVSYISLLPWSTDLTNSAIDLIQIESVAVSPFRPGAIQTVEGPPQPSWKGDKKPRNVQLIEDEQPEQEDEEEERKVPDPWIEDTDPLAYDDSKHPALRRAAIAFLNWVFSVITFKIMSDHSECTGLEAGEILYKEHPAPDTDADLQEGGIPPGLLERAETVLGYVKSTDEDEVARGHAESAERMLGMLKASIMIRSGGAVEGSGLEDLSESLEKLKVDV
ncbi:hypothetical protein CNBA0830 [Cryptococcus deneoformans B-3501A]|uniref:RNA polymerase II assembly factor Rtp1 C-terminal domain-containing protein n=1 Tax=Cryptococcus deneoformans (strain JEC21 / ATCC MYA-565) TaxID=214684 RepID=Q5KQ11_CRYD1|nr:hypothetical protein CNA00860 [Cryptococcus neoformans var. neoformans JEC21]XP_778080.1 hypothetical protein CNBA0830 [Cryptococcus neoformans var. neoformans B-3501A]AAW40694.2 hypothetical protein CNA00860 [Cryptococcus neoformans var. neoformans JEC21]EAL23433.1 hypothetical protein CNBA0830 [Cryptococcus neoformans var. neoformans B-3501A]